MTAKHHNPGLKRDAASIWIEDITQSSCRVCLRELQNYAGSHKDIHVVSIALHSFPYNSTNNVKRVVIVYRLCFYVIYEHYVCAHAC